MALLVKRPTFFSDSVSGASKDLRGNDVVSINMGRSLISSFRSCEFGMNGVDVATLGTAQ